MADSRIIGDLIGYDDDGLGDLVGDLELGRRLRKGMRRRAARHGLVPASQVQRASALRHAQLRELNDAAMESGDSLTAGHYVADSGQRELYLPFSSFQDIAAAAGSTATLSVTVQRPCAFKRLILTQYNATTLADDGILSAITGFFIGVDPVFNAAGQAPLNAFAFNAVGNHLETPVARVGTVVTVQVTRITAGANAGKIGGYLVGISADR